MSSIDPPENYEWTRALELAEEILRLKGEPVTDDNVRRVAEELYVHWREDYEVE